MLAIVAAIEIGVTVIVAKVVEIKIMYASVKKMKAGKVLKEIYQKEIARREHLISPKNHETKIVNINGLPFAIDVDMIPLVRWMNKLDATETLYCCQGDYFNSKGVWKSPYLLFRCYDMNVCEYITSVIKPHRRSMNSKGYALESAFMERTIDSWWLKGFNLRFTLRVFDRLALQDLNKKIKKLKVPSQFKKPA